jgi:hypothetical protein
LGWPRLGGSFGPEGIGNEVLDRFLGAVFYLVFGVFIVGEFVWKRKVTTGLLLFDVTAVLVLHAE